MSTVEYSLNSEGSVGEHRATPFYRGKYRLLCGKGFGSFTIWDVTLSHLPDTRSDGSVAGGMIGQYSDHWVVISTGSVGAPVLEFGFLSSNPLNYNSTEALVLGNEKKFLKIYNFTKPSHTNDMDNADTILMGGGRNLKTLCKNSLRILCSSADSLWMFGGLEELIVYRYYHLILHYLPR